MNQPSCTKVRFRDEITAKIALYKIARKDDAERSKSEARAYRCRKCHGWHLTSQPKRAGAKP